MQAMKTKANAFINQHKKDFFQDNISPSAGNPKGSITLVEFWTTWCGACKRLLPQLNTLKNTIPSPAFEVLLVNVEGRGNPQPELVNSDPYGQGWMIEIEFLNSNPEQNLLSAAQYIEQCKDQE